MSGQSTRLLPGTSLGAWTLGLVVLMPVLFIIGSSLAGSLYESIPAGTTILADIEARPFLALSMLAGMAAGVAAFVVGLLAILKRNDRTLLVYAATVIGGLTILFLLGELAFPH